jgi:hypothetical protein
MFKVMKTLVIHPEDPSTDFLKGIYKDKDWTVFTEHRGNIRKRKFYDMVKEHDRIIMMGHGCPAGLFYTHIDSEIVPILREKVCVCIWCNADQFVHKYGLKGFFTGMFISEVSEARWFGMKDVLQDEVTYSNVLFSMELNKVIDEPNAYDLIKEAYKGVFENDVIRFNNERLYHI